MCCCSHDVFYIIRCTCSVFITICFSTVFLRFKTNSIVNTPNLCSPPCFLLGVCSIAVINLQTQYMDEFLSCNMYNDREDGKYKVGHTRRDVPQVTTVQDTYLCLEHLMCWWLWQHSMVQIQSLQRPPASLVQSGTDILPGNLALHHLQ